MLQKNVKNDLSRTKLKNWMNISLFLAETVFFFTPVEKYHICLLFSLVVINIIIILLHHF